MLIEAIVDKGQLKLLKSVQFAHDQVHVVVDVPDSEILRLEFHHTDNKTLSSSYLLKQLWAGRQYASTEESDLLEGIEKHYE